MTETRFDLPKLSTGYYGYFVRTKDRVDPYAAEKGLTSPAYFEFIQFEVDRPEVVTVIGWFRFSTLQGNCGVVVSSDTLLNNGFRGNPLYSQKFRDAKEQLVRQLGYSAMIATTQMSNIPAVGNMFKSKYRIVETFTNARTNNLCGIGVKLL
jgi:hypothetical protein